VQCHRSGTSPDIDQQALALSVGATTFTVGTDNAGQTTIIALEYALDHGTPVILAAPYDLAAAAAADEVLPPCLTVKAPVTPHSEATDAAATALASAERPLILAGRDAWAAGAGPSLGRLADALGAVGDGVYLLGCRISPSIMAP
jgi:acetolactate synthase-1/2/3 large subunit